jgi:hypothetical protein
MEKVLRFSDYDVFAYIASGLAALLLCDLLLGTHVIVSAQWSVAEGVIITFAAYVVGHVVAWPSSWLIERQFVARLLGPPSMVLFVERKQHTALAQLLFPDYFTPLDRALRQRVKTHAPDAADHSGQSFFWSAFACVKRDPPTYARMEAFLKLYGFCRNIAFVALFGGVTLLIAALFAAWQGTMTLAGTRVGWAFVALLIGVAMLYRFLKFYRLYSVEVFVGYAELAAAQGGPHHAH